MKRTMIIITLLIGTLLLSACDDITIDNIDEIIETNIVYEEPDIINEVVNDMTEDYGSLGALDQTVFTIEEMIVYALQDEYAARGEYIYIMDEFDVTKPFSNIKNSEETHIKLLLPLFTAYSIAMIEDTSSSHLYVIGTLTEAYEIGVIAEINNIAMYNLFLEQEDLPQDLVSAFTSLRDASINHLAAFQKQVDKSN